VKRRGCASLSVAPETTERLDVAEIEISMTARIRVNATDWADAEACGWKTWPMTS
jgi:hypothetical protein